MAMAVLASHHQRDVRRSDRGPRGIVSISIVTLLPAAACMLQVLLHFLGPVLSKGGGNHLQCWT